MKPPPFAYHDPTTIEEAVDLIGRLENAMPLAGGQSLMPMLNFRAVTPDHVVDLNRVPDRVHEHVTRVPSGLYAGAAPLVN
jgi:carbon-monoxide dehydrogenase medium subunit